MKTLTVTLTVAALLATAAAAAHADTNARSSAPTPVAADADLINATGEERKAGVRISGQRSVRRGRRARFLITGHSGPGRWLQVSVKLAGYSCGAPRDIPESTVKVLSGGDFRVPGQWPRFGRSGRYRLCVWVVENILDPQPEASASHTLRVSGR